MKMWTRTRGGHWPRKGVWGCAALKTPFSRLSCRSLRVPFQAKESVHKTPFWLRKFGNFSLYSLNFHPNLEIFSSQAPNLEIFGSQAPLFRGICQFASPTLRKSGPHNPTWKKVECPPPGPGSLVVISSTAYLLNLFPDDPVCRPTSVHIPFTLFSSQINGHLKTLWLYPGMA